MIYKNVDQKKMIVNRWGINVKITQGALTVCAPDGNLDRAKSQISQAGIILLVNAGLFFDVSMF